MYSKYDFIKDLNPSKEEWRIKARVVRTWKVPNFQQKHFDDNVEMILLDEKGGRVHAAIKGSLNIHNKIHEGEVYFIKFFGVGLNSGSFRPTKHDYRLSFNLRTDVKSTIDSAIPTNGFDFDVIEKESSDSPYLVDVIGLVSGIGEVREHIISGRKTKMVVVELDNLRGHKLECTLWEDYVDQVQQILGSNQSPPNVIIVQLARIKGFRGEFT
ncbi:replication protein A 70 kDa DNA-binding subunit B-like [Gastrolobium bilobum]|uniref:replication protein A 70 kDa DNA-binding subunit B-like n=1 Tax=Gastrolobium bilobum TaxID=150636 RepID=UPI002AB201E7|nr:replication protein A 70 kDa DNA-binding subunit B-like [Gastrolobium bilobum]